jgi:hypothetical protein
MSDEGEVSLEESSLQSQPPPVEEESTQQPPSRPAYCIALLAGANVKPDALKELIAGGSTYGLQLLDYGDILSAEDDPDLAAQVKSLEEGARPAPELVSGLLHSVLRRPAPASENSSAEFEGNNNEPGKELLGIQGGPRVFQACYNLPLSEELARRQVDGGFVDAVILCTQAPKVVKEDAEAEQAEEEPAEIDPAVLEERKKLLEEGMQREETFMRLKGMASEAANAAGHARINNVVFGTLSVPDEDPPQALGDLIKLLVVLVKADVEYSEWIQGVRMFDAPEASTERRHYDRVLSSLPHSCLSVPILLHALVEQVVQQAEPSREVGDVAADADAREALKTNKVALACVCVCVCVCTSIHRCILIHTMYMHTCAANFTYSSSRVIM